MTVNTSTVISPVYAGNDVTVDFDFPFRVENKNQVSVYKTSTAGVTTTLTVSSDYSVNNIGDDDGGYVTLSTALATGETLFMVSNYLYTQLTAFSSQGAYFPDIHEAALDKLTYLVLQMLDTQQRRTLLFDNSITDRTPEQNTLPDPSIGSYLAWDVDESLTNAAAVPGGTDDLDRYDSLAALIAAAPTADIVYVTSYYGGWAGTATGPVGGHYRYKTGFDNTTPSVGTSVSVSTIGTGIQAGLCWDADGNEWAVEGLRSQGYVAIEWFGAKADGTYDDIGAIKDAIIYARRLREALFDHASIAVRFPKGSVYVSEGIPIVKGVNYYCESRWGTNILCDGNTSAAYTAVLDHTTGVFTDNLNATLGEVTSGAKEVVNSSIENLHFTHYGSITGTAPSGANWDYCVQLVGYYDCELRNVRVSVTSTNIGGLTTKYSWRIKIYNYYTSRGGTTGGIGLFLDSECNAAEVYGPRISGDWAYGMRSTNPYSVSVFECHIESVNGTPGYGLWFGGESFRLFGGYFEANNFDIKVGDSAASDASDFLLDHCWFNGGSSVTTNHINLNNAFRGVINRPRAVGTTSGTFFNSNAAVDNAGNVITLAGGDASAPGLVALGLDQGNNVVEFSGVNFGDYTNAAINPSVSGASSSYNNTPSVGAGTDFVAGVGIVAATPSQLLFDTVQQTVGVAMLFGIIGRDQSTATALTAAFEIAAINVNGVTLNRPRLQLFDGGTAFSINTTNLTAGNSIIINCHGFLL